MNVEAASRRFGKSTGSLEDTAPVSGSAIPRRVAPAWKAAGMPLLLYGIGRRLAPAFAAAASAPFAAQMCVVLFACAILVSGLTARAADEEALTDLWKQHMETPDDHETVIKACRDYAAAHAGDPLLPVVRGIEEWRVLRAGRRLEALQMMTADLGAPAGSMNDGARRLAQGWLTRADREQLAAQLQGYYRQQVAYPKALDQLPPEARPLLVDRFGKPWTYKLTGFAKVPGFTDQKYSLQSAVLGDVSDFKSAEKLAYAARIQASPAQVLAAPGNTQAVKFNIGGNAAVVGLGQASGDLYLAFVGAHIVIVCDYTHWKILPRP